MVDRRFLAVVTRREIPGEHIILDSLLEAQSYVVSVVGSQLSLLTLFDRHLEN
jgi:hypothetical protein